MKEEDEEEKAPMFLCETCLWFDDLSISYKAVGPHRMPICKWHYFNRGYKKKPENV